MRKCGNLECDQFDLEEDNHCKEYIILKNCGKVMPLKGKTEPVAEVTLDCRVMDDLGKAAQSLFDNRLGWSAKANPFAPREFWADLGAALYGEDDPRVKELR